MARKWVVSCFFFLFIISLMQVVYADDESWVYNEPMTVNVDQRFNMSFYCNPATFIKAWECKITYDYTLLRFNNLTYGDFFDGYDVFHNPDVFVEKGNGTIINIYELVLGKGNVSSEGCLFTLNFTAMHEGVAYVEIYDLMLTNETQAIETVCIQNCVVGILDVPEPEENETVEPEEPIQENETQNNSSEKDKDIDDNQNNIIHEDDTGETVNEDNDAETEDSFQKNFVVIVAVAIISLFVIFTIVKLMLF